MCSRALAQPPRRAPGGTATPGAAPLGSGFISPGIFSFPKCSWGQEDAEGGGGVEAMGGMSRAGLENPRLEGLEWRRSPALGRGTGGDTGTPRRGQPPCSGDQRALPHSAPTSLSYRIRQPLLQGGGGAVRHRGCPRDPAPLSAPPALGNRSLGTPQGWDRSLGRSSCSSRPKPGPDPGDALGFLRKSPRPDTGTPQPT